MNDQSIEVRKLTPRIGAEIFGVDLGRGISDSQFNEIQRAYLENQVIFFREQAMTLDQHKAFGRRFGVLHINPGARNPMPDHPGVITIKADENSKRVAGDVWHSDVSCDPEPPATSILHIHDVPETGGDTLFASMYAAYEALSDDMKSFLADKRAVHDGDHVYRNKNGPDPADKVYPRAEHPIVRTHPESGRKCLFVNRNFTTRIVGLQKEESDAVLAFLYRHTEGPDFQCRFRWRPGSVAMWDNRCTTHYAVFDYHPQRRFGYRVTVCGDRPF